MEDFETDIVKTYGNRLRVRVCGILKDGNKILLIKHLNIGKAGVLYGPPGGGLEFGESIYERLVSEFKEEASIDIEPLDFIGINEFLDPPLHAIELFFNVKHVEGNINLGYDPEMEGGTQILKEIKFYDIDFIQSLPTEQIHPFILKMVSNQEHLGFYNFFEKKTGN